MKRYRIFELLGAFATALMIVVGGAAHAQSNSGSVTGTISDSTGAVIPGATITIANSVSGYTRTQKSDSAGHFQFMNVPFNPYQLSVTSTGFQTFTKRIDVNSIVAQTVSVALAIESASQTVTVEAPVDLTEQDPNSHTDIDRSTIAQLPVASLSS